MVVCAAQERRSELDKFQESLGSKEEHEAMLIVSTPTPQIETTTQWESSPSSSAFLLQVELERFQLCLNSAKDDIPLFFLTMSGTEVSRASSDSESLLTVKYYEGPDQIAKLQIDGSDDIEAYGDVELSPMRMVYIHAQAFALIEYASAGILGALATQVATIAVYAAAEIATASNSKIVFHVKADSLEVLLPQAAYRRSAFSVFSGTLIIDYS